MELVVSDNDGNVAKDTMEVVVNIPPVSAAGSDVERTLPQNSVVMNGSGSSDADGSITSYQWTRLSGPLQYSISSATAVSPTISNLVKGVYEFQLQVTDNRGATGIDVVRITVYGMPNVAPVAQAGSDQNIVLPTSSTSLNGTASSDADGSIVTYQWSQVSGPNTANIVSPGSATTTVSGLVEGSYEFSLQVTDDSSATDTDNIIVNVASAPNQLPVASAGNDQNIVLPAISTSLNGTASSDPDGSIVTYQWSQLSGPNTANIVSPGSATTTVSGLVEGSYEFRLQVTDNRNGTSTDNIIVNVSSAPNQLPVASAGNDQNIVLPTSSTSLNGTASSDADGSIVTYQWSQLSGPNTANIVSPGSATTTVSGLIEGSYSFELTVTDNRGAIDNDIVVVNVTSPSATKLIKVNLYGGSNAYNQDGWNNWNVTGSTNITSGTFNYEDGTSSGVSAVLSYAQGVADNGSTYGGSMCPPPVLRYTSYSTSTRTVTLNGLNNTVVYDLEFYASRANSGNSTRFIINGVVMTVVTDQNKTVKVNFTDIAPSNGRIVITVERVGTYNYLNGFILTEKSGQPALRTGAATVAENVQSGDNVFGVYPNPFRSGVELSLQNSYKGSMKVWISDAGGRVVRSMNYVKTARTFTTHIGTGELPAGVYVMHLEMEGRVYSRKLLKIN
jgi:hypothetical protein